MFKMVVFADLKSQVVDLKMQLAANQTSTHEVRSDLLSLKSEMSTLPSKLMSLKSGSTHVPTVPLLASGGPSWADVTRDESSVSNSLAGDDQSGFQVVKGR